MIRVNETTFDEAVILNEMQYHNGESQRDAMIKASESLIISELLLQRARALGILEQPVKDGDSQIADQKIGEKKFDTGRSYGGVQKQKGGVNNTLESACADDDTFSEALFEREIDFPSASAADCKHYYDNNQEKFRTTPLLAVSHILLPSESSDELARIEAEDTAKLLIRQLQQDPTQFASLAKLHSSCPSKTTQGQLGQISKGQTVPEFERQLFNCGPGLVLVPIASRYGIHVVNIDERVEGRQMDFDSVNGRIADYLNERVRRKSIAQYIERLIASADIEGFDFSVSESPLVQ